MKDVTAVLAGLVSILIISTFALSFVVYHNANEQIDELRDVIDDIEDEDDEKKVPKYVHTVIDLDTLDTNIGRSLGVYYIAFELPNKSMFVSYNLTITSDGWNGVNQVLFWMNDVPAPNIGNELYDVRASINTSSPTDPIWRIEDKNTIGGSTFGTHFVVGLTNYHDFELTGYIDVYMQDGYW